MTEIKTNCFKLSGVTPVSHGMAASIVHYKTIAKNNDVLLHGNKYPDVYQLNCTTETKHELCHAPKKL
eukprot:scaffold564115_cov24-Prasinocladus_malaysianus.AAC.1